MSQSLWLFGSRLTIVADHTTTAGQYDLIEEYSLPGSQTPLHLLEKALTHNCRKTQPKLSMIWVKEFDGERERLVARWVTQD